MRYTIEKSFFVVTATSATTALAFASNLASGVAPIRLFGAFAALAVASNYWLVCTTVPALLVLKHRWERASERTNDARENAEPARKRPPKKAFLFLFRVSLDRFFLFLRRGALESRARVVRSLASHARDPRRRVATVLVAVAACGCFVAATLRLRPADASAAASSLAPFPRGHAFDAFARAETLFDARRVRDATRVTFAWGLRDDATREPFLTRAKEEGRGDAAGVADSEGLRGGGGGGYAADDLDLFSSRALAADARRVGADLRDPELERAPGAVSLEAPAWDADFDASSPEAQRWLLGFCDALAALRERVADVDCFVADVDRRVAAASGGAARLPMARGAFEAAVDAWARVDGANDLGAVRWWVDPEADANDAGDEDADRAASRRRASPRLAFVSVVATLTPGGGSEDESSANAALAAEAAFWERWFAETMEGTRRRAEATGDGEGAKGENSEKGDAADAIDAAAAATPGLGLGLGPAPSGLRGGFQTSPSWALAATTEAMRRAAFASLAASLLLAALASWLASEGCVRVALACVGCVGLVAVAVLALFERLGWTLGAVECACVTALAGVAVDHVLHVAAAFVAGDSGGGNQRGERARAANTNASGENRNARARAVPAGERAARAVACAAEAVLAGASTTLGAAGFLTFGCATPAFRTFGVFVASAASASAATSLVVLPAALGTFGPGGKEEGGGEGEDVDEEAAREGGGGSDAESGGVTPRARASTRGPPDGA